MNSSIKTVAYQERLFAMPEGQNVVIWTMRGGSSGGGVSEARLIPKGQGMIVFNLGGMVDYDGAHHKIASLESGYLVYSMRQALVLTYASPFYLVGISFYDDGLLRFLGSSEVTHPSSIPSLDKLRILCFRIKDQPFESLVTSIKHAMVEAGWRLEVSKPFSVAIKLLRDSQGTLPIGVLASEAEVTIRQLQRLFQEHVGMSPKQYAKVIRVSAYINYLLAKPTIVDWMDMVEKYGYHDQPHLIREVKHVCNLSPQKLLEYRDTLYHQVVLNS